MKKFSRQTWSIILMISIILLILFRLISMWLFRANEDTYNYNYGMMWGNSPLGYWMIVPMILFVAILYSAYKVFIPNHHHNALAILKERYAKGEISDEEFHQKRKHLDN